ncbi:MAG TPA: metallophosphoesterase [Candidatus Evtepia faecigallinarum]|nr:metallophosphoesterase [Candidatus Evtepia faecigallinarum]
MANAVVCPLVLPQDRRVLVISDIHGNLPFLKGLLHKVGFCGDDILIILGDILEKSTGGLETLRYLMDLRKRYTIYFVQGNCDDVTLGFLNGAWPDEIAAKYGGFWGEKCAWVSMAHQTGIDVSDPKDFGAARKAIEGAFPEELAFLRAMPTILLHQDYLFVHGGVPREDRLEELVARQCMKNDNFLSQGRTFRRWVVVGHWPVTLYRPDIPSAKPLILPQRHIASIDGGCSLKADGQLNALILPREPGGDFTYVAYDGFPVMTALADQSPSPNPLNIRWGHSAVEVLELGEEFSRCLHLESGREMDILTDYLRQGDQGTYCLDSTDYQLPVRAGERLAIVRRTSRGALAKKDGATGWYRGPLEAVK